MEVLSTEVKSDVIVKDLLEAGVHFGHQTKRWNPKMKPFIFGERNGIYIIDLQQSQARLEEARKFLYNIVSSGRKVLFVGTKKQAQEPLKEIAIRLKQPYVVNRWLGGMLTNNRTIRQSIKRMHDLEKMEKDGSMAKLGKKEQAMLRHEYSKLEKNLIGLTSMEALPGALFVVDICRDAIAVSEAVRMNIPVIAMVDTNGNPDPISYPIPANDDAIRSIRVIAEALARTIQQAGDEYEKVAAALARKRAQEAAEAQVRAKAAEEERKVREREARKVRDEALAKAKAAKAEAAAKAKVEADAAAGAAAVEAAAAEAAAAEAAAAEAEAAAAAAVEAEAAPLSEEAEAAPAVDAAAAVEADLAPEIEAIEEEMELKEEKAKAAPKKVKKAVESEDAE